ncbi:hypothetical protein [Acidithiobacillus ferridurans]|uniref:hypothetical protein n=1 Tax=Acidithiobacillus ferridurans TaxID=1232575 RepID=UPI001C0799E6|nr:hypothetical protein [Acidithiobacillus ferridurans]MBU2714566.1 hypothetical protein [Acidithiobacillus ferridurans]MBU2725834.1 hypothetical protein [Acidithiobacillus ferridurans]
MVSLRESWSSRNHVDEKAVQTKGAKRKIGIVAPVILVAAVVTVGAACNHGYLASLDALGARLLTAQPTPQNVKSAVDDTKPVHSGANAVIAGRHDGTPLPSWVQAGLAQTLKAMRASEKKAKAVVAKNTQLQVKVLSDTNNISKLRMEVFADQKRIDGLLVRLQQANAVRPINHQHGGSVVPAQSVMGSGGIIALKSAGASRGSGHLPVEPIVAGSVGVPTKKAAHGWMVIAVHDKQAVVQAPTGQVALVAQGDRIDGHIVRQINTGQRSVLLSGGLLAGMVKHD